MFRRLRTCFVGCGLMFLAHYAHVHPAIDIGGSTSDFGQVFLSGQISYPHVNSLASFNRWLGTSFSSSEPLMWDFWVSLLLLKIYPNLYVGWFLFRVPFQVKMLTFAVLVLVRAWKIKNKKKKRRKKKRDAKKLTDISNKKTRSGDFGEIMTERVLDTLPREYAVYSNVFIKTSQTKSKPFQFDHIIVSPHGIFHVDSKNWKGAIVITDTHVTVNGSVKSDRYYKNPAVQAMHHQEALEEWIGQYVHIDPDVIVPVVCFTHPDCHVNTDEEDFIHICRLDDLLDVIQSYRASILPTSIVKKINTAIQIELDRHRTAN